MDSLSDDEAAAAATSRRTRGAKDLRRSIFSMNASNPNAMGGDLDDEDDDDDSDYSPDHALAKRLQDEEYAEASVEDLERNNTRAAGSSAHQPLDSTPPASTSSGLSTRRAREEPSFIDESPPAKRPRARGPASRSVAGSNATQGTQAQSVSFAGAARSRHGPPAPVRRRARANASFIPASDLLQYGNNPRPAPSNDSSTSMTGPLPTFGELDDDEVNSVNTISSSSPLSSTGDPSTAGDHPSSDEEEILRRLEHAGRERRAFRSRQSAKAASKFRGALERNHPELLTIWDNLEKKPLIQPPPAPQPSVIHRQMKPFQLEGLAWMKEMEASEYKGGILGDEMGLGKTIQAVSLIMSDFPAGKPSLVLVPPVALMQWVSEIDSYTDKALKTFIFHGTNQNTKSIKLTDLKKYDVIMMSYNSLEAMYRRETKGQVKKMGGDDSTVELHKKASIIHKMDFHRIILDEAHGIKVSRPRRVVSRTILTTFIRLATPPLPRHALP